MGGGGGCAPRARIHRGHRGGGPQELGRARADRQGRLVHPAELVRIGMDVHELLARAGRRHEGVAARRHLAQPRPDHQQEVGLPDPLGQPRIDAEPEVARVAGMGVVEAVLAAERRRGGERVRLDEPREVFARPRGPAPAAGDHQGAAGVGEQCAQGRDGIARHPRGDRHVPARIRDGGLLDQHVFRQRDRHRSRPPGARLVERLAHELGDARRIVDLDDPFAQRREEPPVLDLLERLAVGVPALDLADEHHHRRRVLGRGMQPRRGVAGAGTPRDHDHPGPPGELAAGFRHVRGAALVPAGDGGDRIARVVEGVEDREIALARHAEDGVDAVDPEGIDQDPAAGAPIGLLHVRHRRA